MLDAAYEATLWAGVLNRARCVDARARARATANSGADANSDADAGGGAGADADSGSRGSRDVFLTALGGGVFGNDTEWIGGAIGRAVARAHAACADINVRLIKTPSLWNVWTCKN